MDFKLEKLLSDIENLTKYVDCITINGIRLLLEKALFDYRDADHEV